MSEKIQLGHNTNEDNVVFVKLIVGALDRAPKREHQPDGKLAERDVQLGVHVDGCQDCHHMIDYLKRARPYTKIEDYQLLSEVGYAVILRHAKLLLEPETSSPIGSRF